MNYCCSTIARSTTSASHANKYQDMEFMDDSILNEINNEVFTQQELKMYWEVFEEMNIQKKYRDNVDNDLTEIVQMVIVAATLFAISIKKQGNDFKETRLLYTVKSFMTQIANTQLSILKLAKDGMDYQAGILLRSLTELHLMLITICLDEKTRNAYLELPEDSKTLWYKFFRFPKMIAIVQEYEKKFGENIFSMSISSKYTDLSSYVHNDFKYLFTRTYGEKGEELEYNLLGCMATRTSSILEEMVNVSLQSAAVLLNVLSYNAGGIALDNLHETESASKGSYFYFKQSADVLSAAFGYELVRLLKKDNSLTIDEVINKLLEKQSWD